MKNIIFLCCFAAILFACEKDDEYYHITPDGVLTRYTGPGGDVTIPNSVTSIGDGAFYNCDDLTSVTIPNSVTSIGDEAFEYCSSLTSVTIPNSVTSIGGGAFEYCSSLMSVTIPNSVTEIGDKAFEECSSLTSVYFNAINCISMGEDVFKSCSSLSTLTIGDQVQHIPGNAFRGCRSLASVTIPGSVTSIGGGAFEGCSSLTSATVPGSVTSIGGGVFRNCTELFGEQAGGIKSFLPDNAFWREGRTPFRLDGWYGETYNVSLNGTFASLRFSFRDKYKELGIEDCVYIEVDGKRVYPVRQAGDSFILDLTGVDRLFIKSIHPGKSYTPYSQEITLDGATFYR